MIHLSHSDLLMPGTTRDKADVQSIVKLLEDYWTNRFDPNESELVRISTCTLAPPYVTSDILAAHKIGMAAYGEFKRDRLEDEIPKAQFHDKITMKRLMTFSDNRKKTSASNSNNVSLQAVRNQFAHMVLVAESRHLRISDVLPHLLVPLPWALANGDGTMRKTNKAALAGSWKRRCYQQKASLSLLQQSLMKWFWFRRWRAMTRYSLNLQSQHCLTSFMKESGVTESMWSSMRSEKTRSRTQRDRTRGALQEYNCETWRQVTWSSNGESFSADGPIRPTS